MASFAVTANVFLRLPLHDTSHAWHANTSPFPAVIPRLAATAASPGCHRTLSFPRRLSGSVVELALTPAPLPAPSLTFGPHLHVQAPMKSTTLWRAPMFLCLRLVPNQTLLALPLARPASMHRSTWSLHLSLLRIFRRLRTTSLTVSFTPVFLTALH